MNEPIEYSSGVINPSECISKGWEALKPNYGLFLGITLLSILISLLVCIPVVGLIFLGPISCGLYYVMLRQIRGQNVELGMMFQGFHVFVAAMVAGLIVSIPQIISQFVDVGELLISLFATYTKDPSITQALAVLSIPITVIKIFLGVCSFIVGIFLMFAYPLVVDRNLSAIEAVKLSFSAAKENFGGLFLLMILEGLIMLAGVLALCIGMLFVLPVILAANVYAYEKVFPNPNAPNTPSDTPPSPADYGNNFGQAM